MTSLLRFLGAGVAGAADSPVTSSGTPGISGTAGPSAKSDTEELSETLSSAKSPGSSGAPGVSRTSGVSGCERASRLVKGTPFSVNAWVDGISEAKLSGAVSTSVSLQFVHL